MTDQGSEGLLSPYLRRKRFHAAFPYLKGKILDFGCGSGMLAALVPKDQYYGVEVDSLVLQKAILAFPNHHFATTLPNDLNSFDTIVSLAVIEHVSDSAHFLRLLVPFLRDAPSSRIIITTPHPHFGWIHHIGAFFGLFSKHAHEEHQDLLDLVQLENVGNQAGLKLVFYQRFLFGANQIAIYAKNDL